MAKRLTRRSFIQHTLSTTAAMPLLGKALASTPAFPAQPNIVLILTDQERFTRYFPEQWVEQNLPNFMRLRNKGMFFSNNFCNSSMCSPSRATLFTGLYPAQHHVADTLPESTGGDKTDKIRDLDPNMQNMAKVLKSAGYQVVYKGKWHLSRPQGTEWTVDDVGRFGFDGWDPPDGGEDNAPENFGGGRSNHDQRFMEDTLAFLKSVDTSKPFALVVSLINPHDVAAYPSTYSEDYSADFLQGSIELPPTLNEDLEQNFKPKAHAELLNRLALGLGPLLTDKRRKEYLNFYGNLLKHVDGQIGQILDALYAPRDSQPALAESTLVIRTADHGEMGLAHGGLRQKMFVTYEEMMHLPLIISNPVLFPSARTCNALVSLIDLLPTMAAIAKAPQREQWAFRGIDFSPLLTNPEQNVQDAILFTFDDIKAGQENIEHMVNPPNRIRCIREKNWKYARYFDGDGQEAEEYEMYDLVNDPQELQNLAHPRHPRYNEAGIVQERNRLAAKLAQMEKEKLSPLTNEVQQAIHIPQTCELAANFPNPFNAATRIRFRLAGAQQVTLEVHNEKGEQIVRLLDHRMTAGVHSLIWNGCDAKGRPAASGIYFCLLRAGGTQQRQTMTLLR